jgi:hypothetical protein
MVIFSIEMVDFHPDNKGRKKATDKETNGK